MNTKCVFHPGRDVVVSVAGKGYCEKCETGQKAARVPIKDDIKPKGCFVVYRGGDTWEPIFGTGCAHFVAHEKNMRAPGGVAHCLEGFLIRVVDLLLGLKEVKELSDVEPGDIYVNPDRDHCGIVRTVIPGPGRGRIRIMIEHASSRLRMVSTNDFTVYFRGKGSFFR
jgi:hypothetical protein